MATYELELLDEIAQAAESGATVITVGSMNADSTVTVDAFPRPGETVTGRDLALLPGGKSSNEAVAAALLGARAQICGLVGTDQNADFLLGCLADAGVDTSAVARAEGPSGAALITVEAGGENAIVYAPGANALLTPEFVEGCADVLAGADVLGLCLESPLAAVLTAARIGHEAGATVLLNCSPVPAVPAEELAAVTDVLLVNDVEALQLLGLDVLREEKDWEAVAHAIAELGFSRLIITLGAEGSLVFDKGAHERIAAVPVQAQDTTGCGDSFMGTVLAGLAAGATLARSARLASLVSAYAACGRGAQSSYGSAEEIRAFAQMLS